MNKDALVHMLVAMRAQIDSALALLVEDDGSEPQECQHPEDARENLSTMGHRHWRCKECGYEHEEVIAGG